MTEDAKIQNLQEEEKEKDKRRKTFFPFLTMIDKSSFINDNRLPNTLFFNPFIRPTPSYHSVSFYCPLGLPFITLWRSLLNTHPLSQSAVPSASYGRFTRLSSNLSAKAEGQEIMPNPPLVSLNRRLGVGLLV